MSTAATPTRRAECAGRASSAACSVAPAKPISKPTTPATTVRGEMFMHRYYCLAARDQPTPRRGVDFAFPSRDRLPSDPVVGPRARRNFLCVLWGVRSTAWRKPEGARSDSRRHRVGRLGHSHTRKYETSRFWYRTDSIGKSLSGLGPPRSAQREVSLATFLHTDGLAPTVLSASLTQRGGVAVSRLDGRGVSLSVVTGREVVPLSDAVKHRSTNRLSRSARAVRSIQAPAPGPVPRIARPSSPVTR